MVTNYREAGKVTLFQACDQMLPDSFMINITVQGLKPVQISRAYAMARTPQSAPFAWFSTSMILISSFEEVLEIRLAINSQTMKNTSCHIH